MNKDYQKLWQAYGQRYVTAYCGAIWNKQTLEDFPQAKKANGEIDKKMLCFKAGVLQKVKGCPLSFQAWVK